MTTTAPSPTGVAVVESAYQATSAGDLEAFVALLEPNVEWRLAESDGLPYDVDNPIVGREALVAKLSEVARIIQYTHEIDEVIDAGDTVVATGVYHGVYLPTGREFTMPFVHIWRVREGRVAAFRQFIDAAPVVRAIAEAD
jgi:ketosteroid isomerase-like protein